MKNLKSSGLSLRTIKVVDYSQLVEDLQYNFVQVLNAPGFKGSPGESIEGPAGIGIRGSKWIFVSLTNFPDVQSINELNLQYVNTYFQNNPQGFVEHLTIPDGSSLVYGDTIVLPSGQIIQLIAASGGDEWIDTGISFGQVATLSPDEITKIVQDLLGPLQNNEGFKYFNALAKNASDQSPAQNGQLTNDGAVDIKVADSGPGYLLDNWKFYGPAETQITSGMNIMQIVGSVKRYHELIQQTQTSRTNSYLPGVDDWASLALLQNSYNNGLIFGHKNSTTFYDFGRLYRTASATILTSNFSSLESEYSEIQLLKTQALLRAISEIEIRTNIFRVASPQMITAMFNYVDDTLTLGTNNSKVVFDASKGVFLERIKNAKILSTDTTGKIVSELTVANNLNSPSVSQMVNTKLLSDSLTPIKNELSTHQSILDSLLTTNLGTFKSNGYITSSSTANQQNVNNQLSTGYVIFDLDVTVLTGSPVWVPANQQTALRYSMGYLKTYQSTALNQPGHPNNGIVRLEQEMIVAYAYASTSSSTPVTYRKFGRYGTISTNGNVTLEQWIEQPMGQGALRSSSYITISNANAIEHNLKSNLFSTQNNSKQYLANLSVDSAGHIESHQSIDAEQQGYFTPTGSVITMASTTIPSGYLPCRGQYVMAIHYPNLYRLITSTFGPVVTTSSPLPSPGQGLITGDSSNIPTNLMFKLPDLRGVFIRGWNDMSMISTLPDSGRAFGSYQYDMIKRHKHASHFGEHYTSIQWNPYGYTGNGTQWGLNGKMNFDKDNYIPLTNDGDVIPGQGTQGQVNPAGEIGHETRPINVALLYCIKF